MGIVKPFFKTSLQHKDLVEPGDKHHVRSAGAGGLRARECVRQSAEEMRKRMPSPRARYRTAGPRRAFQNFSRIAIRDGTPRFHPAAYTLRVCGENGRSVSPAIFPYLIWPRIQRGLDTRQKSFLSGRIISALRKVAVCCMPRLRGIMPHRRFDGEWAGC